MITIGVTTYNRLETLKRMARSFYASERPYPYAVRVYDDASTEFGEDVLWTLFPDAVSIHRHPHNMGSDANIWYMYQDFLNRNDELFFNADSDILFSKDWMENGVSLLKESDGILSIFNTPNHKAVKETENLIEKKDIGSAGTFFRRDILEKLVHEKKMVENNLYSEGLDFFWCRFFQSHGIKIFSSKKSFVQHIGFEGYNSNIGSFDYGLGFQVDSIENGQFINDSIEGIFCSQTLNKNRVSYVLFPFEIIPKGAKIILYGFGATGKDYVNQIMNSGYCKIVAVVDKNYASMDGVKSPHTLLELDFDYIVLSTLRFDFAEDMKRDIAALSPQLLNRVVQKANGSSPIRL